MIVERGDPWAAKALLEASHALMESLFPPEDNHYLSIDALCVPDIAFYLAKTPDVIGCAALKTKDGYGEIKSLYVDEAARGTGAADALMDALEAEARAQGLPVIKLETGNLLHAAHKLYARHGYTSCGPFGDYFDSPSSLFMEKTL